MAFILALEAANADSSSTLKAHDVKYLSASTAFSTKPEGIKKVLDVLPLRGPEFLSVKLITEAREDFHADRVALRACVPGSIAIARHCAAVSEFSVMPVFRRIHEFRHFSTSWALNCQWTNEDLFCSIK